MNAMMQVMSGWKVAGVAATLCGMCLWAGCQDPPSRLNAPPQGPSSRTHEMQNQYTYMNDNALLAEMSISPVHFIPNRPDISGVGYRRLTRYAELLQQYPGTLYYDGLTDPEPLAAERMERVRAFLAEAGVDPNLVKVELGVAGGQGLRGSEAVAVRNYTSFSPRQAENQAPAQGSDTFGN